LRASRGGEWVLDRAKTQLAGFADHFSAFDSAYRHPDCESVRIMVTTVGVGIETPAIHPAEESILASATLDVR